MTTPLRHVCFIAALLLPLLAAIRSVALHAAEPSAGLQGTRSLPPLAASSVADITAARDDAAARLTAVRRQLDQQAIGVILDAELELDLLAAELQRDHLDDASLRRIERSLRRILPGAVQHTVNALRASVARLARLNRLTVTNLETGDRALATIEAHLRDEGLRSSRDGESELREAYAVVSDLLPSVAAVESLKRRLSTANYTTFLSRDFVSAIARQQFDEPVHFRSQRQGALIAADGSIRITLSATVPECDGENRLLLHAVGAGHIDATADRRRVHVRAESSPSVDGSQLLRILPTRVTPADPTVTADVHTRLSGISLDGLLGKCELAKRLASRAIQDRLTESDRTVAQTIETSVRDRVREEGILLAYRINGLLRYAVWDRLAALDESPRVRLRNDAAGMWSETFYTGDSQLAAVSARPPVPPVSRSDLALLTWVHESAVANSLGLLRGVRVDEATVRGLWEVQFQLTSADWESLPPGRTPAAITLEDASPVSMRFLAGVVELDLRAAGSELDGKDADGGPCSVRIRYHVDKDAVGPRLIREPFAFSETMPVEKRAIWEKVLGLFFGREIHPMPRFANANVHTVLALDSLNMSDGWLAVGLRRATPTAPQPQTVSEVSR